MSNQTMILTPEEVRLIEQRRAEQAMRINVIAVREELLRVAHAYRAWLDAEQAGSTYSTFCNDFGYQLPEWFPPPSQRNRVYEAVHELFALANNQAEKITGVRHE